MYDYYLDFFKGTLVKWEDRPGAQFKTLASSFTVVPEVRTREYRTREDLSRGRNNEKY